MKKRITAVIAGLLCLSLLLGLVPLAFAQEEKVSYEYALLGDVYTPKENLISGTTPTGAEIPAGTASVVLDWAQGSYLFQYPGQTVNVKVYEAAPQDTVRFTDTVPAAVSAGLATRFPGCGAQSTVRRTDGAPAIEPYAVSAVFWFGGEKVQTVRDVSEPFFFTAQESGLWMVTYEYTDVFGRVRTQDYPFTVTSDRIIVSSIGERYFVGNSIQSSAAYGFYNGEQHPVSMTAELPDGTKAQVGDRFVFAQEGTYTLTASVEMEGETVERVHTVTVASGLQSFLSDKEGFTAGTVEKKQSNIDSLTDGKGLLLDMSASTASFTYNGVVDLNKLGKNTPVISFSPNHSYGGSIGKVTVTMTDVYDPSNTVSVIYTRNADMTATAKSYDNTLVQASFGGTTVAVGNYYPLTGSSVGWSTSFHSYWNSDSNTDPDKSYNSLDTNKAMNFAFDTATNTVYSYGHFYLVEWDGKTKPAGYPTTWDCTWFPIADLDNKSLSDPFGGFTTGEVLVSLRVDSGRGDIMLHSIGGVSMSELEAGYGTDSGILLEGFDGSQKAAVGVEYTLPAGTSGYIRDLQRTVTFDGQTVEVTGDRFTPAKTGTYLVTYTGINQFGSQVSKTVELPCTEKPELTVSYKTQAVKLGEIYTVQTPEVTGYGQLSTAITVNGQAVQPGQKLKVEEKMVISVTAQDALDTIEKTWELKVDTNVVTYGIDFPRSALCGTEFTFPEANILDHSTGKTLAYTVYVDGKKQENTVTLPQEPDTLSVEYRTEKGSKRYTLAVRKAEAATGAEALMLPAGGKAETNDAGTMVTVSAADPVVRLPHKLSATGLAFQFIVLEEKLNFNTMTMGMTDGEGTCVTASVVGLQEDTPYLYVNGKNTLVALSKQSQTFASGAYEGKAYYAYTLQYHDLYRAMLNASKIEATVTEDTRGLAFTGFQGGVYLDIYPQDIRGGSASFGITQIGNQYFYTSAFEYGDIVAPSLSTTDFFIGHNNIPSGYVLKLKELRAYDLLTGECPVTVTLMLSDGTVVCRDADPATVEDTVLDKAGTNLLKIQAADAAGSRLDMSYRFTIEDTEGPALTVSGDIPATAKAGASLDIPGASGSDASAMSMRLVVFDPNGKLTVLATGETEISATKLENLRGGIYRIRYIATDEWGNASTQVLTVTVEE